jgi:hypothetical protein
MSQMSRDEIDELMVRRAADLAVAALTAASCWMHEAADAQVVDPFAMPDDEAA